MQLILRRATMDDGEHLLRWRNDPATRENSFNSDTVSRESHFCWLEVVLANANRDLYIAEVDNIPVGTLRIDRDASGQSELSWTVAPESRGRGVGKAMLQAVRVLYEGELVALIKKENIASIKMATTSGFELFKEENGTLYYRSLPTR